MQTLVIINPAAGSGRSESQIPLIKKTLLKMGFEAEYETTTAPNEGTNIALQAAKTGSYETIIAVGGDGTVNEVANGLVGSNVLLGAIPAGTGNDITSALGIPMETVAACHLLKKGKTRKVDMGLVTGRNRKRYFIGVSGIGFDAEVTKKANETSKRYMTGTLPYAISIFLVLSKYSPIQFKIKIGNYNAIPFEAMMVSVGNGPMYGGHMKICPEARLDDGLFDLVIVGNVPRFHFIRLFPHVYEGKHIRHHSVALKRFKSFELSGDRTTLVQVDGELLGYLPMKFKTIPAALNVITGASPYFTS